MKKCVANMRYAWIGILQYWVPASSFEGGLFVSTVCDRMRCYGFPLSYAGSTTISLESGFLIQQSWTGLLSNFSQLVYAALQSRAFLRCARVHAGRDVQSPTVIFGERGLSRLVDQEDYFLEATENLLASSTRQWLFMLCSLQPNSIDL